MIEEPSDRLRRARSHKGFRGPTEAARAYGWNINTYRSHENGIRDLSKKAAERYASALSVSIGWLLTGENPPKWEDEQTQDKVKPTRKIPKLTHAQAYSLTQGTKLEQIRGIFEFVVIGVDPVLGGDVFALGVSDESMSPEFNPGAEVVVDPDAHWKPGDFVAVSINTMETVVLRQYRISGYDNEEGEMVILAALNNAFPSIPFTPGKTGTILGKVVGQYKRYQ